MLKEFKEEIVMLVGTLVVMLLTIYVFSLQSSDPKTFSSIGKFMIDLIFRSAYILFYFFLGAV